MAGYGATALPGVGGPGRRRIIQWYRFRSERAGLRSQLLALLVLIWLFTLLVVGGVVYRNASVFERSFWEQRQREVASYATRTLTSFIQDTLSRLSGLGLIDPRDREGLSQRLDAFLEATPAVSEVVWLDAQGRVLGSAYRREPVLANLLTIPQSYWFHESTAGRTYLGSVQLSAANQPYLIVSVPVEGKQVLAARMRLDLLWDLAADLGFGRSGVIYLVNRRGEILAHPDPNLVLTQASILGLPELEQALQSDGGVWTGAYHSLSGTAVRGLAMQASGLDWIVIAEMDEEEQGSFSRDLLSMLTGLLGMVGVAVFLGVALVLDRLVLTPVEAMRAGAEKIRTGRLDHRVPVYRQDEVGKVAGAFNEMAAQLQQTLAGLTERAAALEASQRVTFAAAEAEDGAELFNLVANLIRDQFHLYHVQVLLLDRDARRADLFSGTGYAGIQMLRVGYFVPVSGEMPAARALRDGEAVLVEDRDQLDGVRAFLPDACSQLALPMAAQRGMIGVLDLYSSRPGAFPPELVSLLQAMAKQAALSYENRRLLEQTSAQADDLRYFTSQLSTASEVGWRVNQIRDPGQVLKEMTGLMQSRFGYYHVYVYLLDENQEYLALHTASDEVGQVLIQRRHRLPLHSQDKNLIASAARSGRPALVNDVSLISDYRPTPLLPETRAELAVPLVAGECVLGVIDVQDDQPNRFRQSDVDAFSAMAAQITVALENARLFRELEQTAERLREVDRLKSEFLANVSHELRTPLNSIIGYSEMLLMALNQSLDGETLEDLQAIHENGMHLLRLINDVLDLAKIEAGRMTLQLDQVDLPYLLEETCTANLGYLKKLGKPVDLQVSYPAGLPPLRADRLRLMQVLTNLVSNALKFTEQGRVLLSAGRSGAWVWMSVEDTGIGMDEADLALIFEKFRQVDGSHRRRTEGTGLGLAITRSLVELHGGRIEVSSQLGAGSRFVIWLPVEPPAVE